MSLINDALKKAQRQRTGDTAPSPTSAPPMPGGSAAPLRAAPKKDPSPALILVGVGVTLGIVVGLGAFWFLRSSGEAVAAKPTTGTVAAVPTSAATAPAATTAPATPAVTLNVPTAAPVQTASKDAAPNTSASIVSAPPAQPSPASTAPASDSAKLATVSTALPATHAATSAPAPQAPAPSVAAVSAPAKPAGPVEPSEQMVKAIESFRVMGIRAAGGGDAKVLMNDRVFRIGDLVDRTLGIRLTAATTNSLTFQDASGASYTRNF